MSNSKISIKHFERLQLKIQLPNSHYYHYYQNICFHNKICEGDKKNVTTAILKF